MIELDDYGLAIWKHKTIPNYFADRRYRWCDRIIFVSETVEEDLFKRKYVGEMKFSEFKDDEWIPITKEEYKKILEEIIFYRVPRK